MAFFKRDYNKPGPGVSKDEPRKKGLNRFFEIFTLYYGDLIKLNLFFCICALPGLALFMLGLFGFISIVTMPLSVVAAYPIGGALTAVVFCITKMLRDDPGFVWDDCKRKFSENIKQASLPGMVCTLFIYTQVILWGPLEIADESLYAIIVIFALFAFILFAMISPYIFLQIAYVNIKTYPVIKNSIILTLSRLLRSFFGAVFGFAPWIAIIMYFPATLVLIPLILLLGFTFPLLMCLSWIWPPFNARFNIEETLIKQQQTVSHSSPAADFIAD
jgi:hypothetical protein